MCRSGTQRPEPAPVSSSQMGSAQARPRGATRTDAQTGIDARDWASDCLKAAAIVGVVCIHAGLPYSAALRFCVPVFIALWAFHAELGLSRRTEQEQWPYLRSRFLRLLAPYAFWTGIHLALFHDLQDWRTTPVHTIVGGWFGGYGWAGQYFFIILFQWVLLLPVLRRVVRPDTLWLIVAIGCAWNVTSCYLFFGQSVVARLGDRLFVYWIPYAALGIAFARSHPPRLPNLSVLAVILLLAAPLEYAVLAQWQPRASPYLAASVTLGTVAMLIALGPRRQQNDRPPDRLRPGWPTLAVAYLGRNTMAVFVCHVLVLELASRTGLVRLMTTPSVIFGKAGLVAIAIATSLLIAGLLRRIGLGLVVGGRAI